MCLPKILARGTEMQGKLAWDMTGSLMVMVFCHCCPFEMGGIRMSMYEKNPVKGNDQAEDGQSGHKYRDQIGMIFPASG